MLSVVWVLVTIIVAALVVLSSKLLYTAGFLVMLGVTGALALNSKWIYALVGLCCAALLLVAAFYFEPGWFKSLLNVFSFAIS